MTGREGIADNNGFTGENADTLADAGRALRMAGTGRSGVVAVTVELSELEALALRFRGRCALQRENRVREALGFEPEPIPEAYALQWQVQSMVRERAGQELDSLLARLLDARADE